MRKRDVNEEPGAGELHAGICGGGARQLASLPRFGKALNTYRGGEGASVTVLPEQTRPPRYLGGYGHNEMAWHVLNRVRQHRGSRNTMSV